MNGADWNLDRPVTRSLEAEMHKPLVLLPPPPPPPNTQQEKENLMCSSLKGQNERF